MPTDIIMPALELAQETGKVVHWLKRAGDTVRKGEPIVEIETDKVTVEIEAPASGVLRDVTAQEGDVVPVGRTIAIVVGTDEAGAAAAAATVIPPASAAATGAIPMPPTAVSAAVSAAGGAVKASPLARKIAEQHGVDLAWIRTPSGRVEKADVLAYVESQKATGNAREGRLVAASPKARRLAAARGLDLAAQGHKYRPGGCHRRRPRRARHPSRRHSGSGRARRPAGGRSGPRPDGQAAPGRHPGRRIHDQQPRDVRRGRIQCDRQSAAGRHSRRRPHRRPGGRPQWPARRPADDDADPVV